LNGAQSETQKVGFYLEDGVESENGSEQENKSANKPKNMQPVDGLLFKNELLTVHVKTQEPLPSIVKSERSKNQHPSLPRESHPIP
jgi:hypothetical protein